MLLTNGALLDQLIIGIMDLLRNLQGCSSSFELLKAHMSTLKMKLIKLYWVFELFMDSSECQMKRSEGASAGAGSSS